MTFGQSMNDIRTLQNDSMTKYELHNYEAPLGHSNKVCIIGIRTLTRHHLDKVRNVTRTKCEMSLGQSTNDIITKLHYRY